MRKGGIAVRRFFALTIPEEEYTLWEKFKMTIFPEPTAVPGDDTTIWQDLWYYIYTNYIYPEDIYYENLNLSAGSMVNLRNILFGLLFGLIIASFAMTFNKRFLGKFVRAVLSAEVLLPESAKTLEELGFSRNYLVRHGVRKGTNIRTVVKCREEEEYNASLREKMLEYEERRKEDPSMPPFKWVDYSVDADRDHFYIPEEKKYSAEMRFEKRGSSWGALIFVIIISIVLFAALLFVIPEVLKLVDNFVGAVR